MTKRLCLLPIGSETDEMLYVDAPSIVDATRLTEFGLPARSDNRANFGLSITNGRPNWLNTFLTLLAVDSGWYRWVALFNARTPGPTPSSLPGSIVVSSRDPHVPIGSFIDNGSVSPIGYSSAPSCAPHAYAGLAVGVIGLPNSGKSVFTRAMSSHTTDLPHVFAIEANPDGQGMYYQFVQGELYERVRQSWQFTDDLGEQYFQQILSLRKKLHLLWVGLGGRPSPQAKRTLEACTHAVLLRREVDSDTDRALLEDWRRLCNETQTPIVADIDSQWQAVQSQVLPADASGAVRGVAAKLQRGDPQSNTRCRPLAGEILGRLVQTMQPTVSAEELASFRARAENLQAL